jgi:putative copper resistance protein D
VVVRAETSSGTPARVGSLLVAALALFGLLGLVLALVVGGDVPKASALGGILEAPPDVQWALPIARTATDLCAAAAVGLLLAAAALVPSARDLLSTAPARAARLAGWFAWVWALLALAVLVLSYADIFATGIGGALNLQQLLSFVSQSDQGAAWLVTASLAAFAGVVARESNTPLGAWFALALAVLATLPPALTGHAASAGSHDLATSSLVVHIVCVVLWVGGVLALLWYAKTDGRYLSLAAQRFSAMALWLYIGVGISGVVNAWVRLDGLGNLLSTRYGAVLLLKVFAFVALGMLGWAHRRHTLPEVEAERRGAFARLAAVEGCIMVATIGVAVGLGTTAPPGGTTSVPTPAEILLGLPVPGPPTFSSLFTGWRLDLLAAAVLLIGALAYGRWLWRLRRRGDSWPIGRAIAWYGGLTVIAFGTLSGFATYGRTTFSLHMTQHMVLSMIVPLLLVLGAPITLALRALPASGPKQPAGAREWLLSALQSPVSRVLTHPVTAFVLFVTAPYLVYFSGLFETAMREHWAHELMHVHFVLVGYLFFESLIGRDPIPYRASYPMRMVTLFASLALHAFFAVALISSNSVIAASYYETLARPWWPDLLKDQTQGASFAWAFGELPAIIVLVVLLFQWSREDDRRAQQADRQADRDGDAQLHAYNQMLAARQKGDLR